MRHSNYFIASKIARKITARLAKDIANDLEGRKSQELEELSHAELKVLELTGLLEDEAHRRMRNILS